MQVRAQAIPPLWRFPGFEGSITFTNRYFTASMLPAGYDLTILGVLGTKKKFYYNMCETKACKYNAKEYPNYLEIWCITIMSVRVRVCLHI